MSRWGRGRAAGVVLPLDRLFRENSNCPSAARSAGTVGKWGITSFTSIRSHPYAFEKPRECDQPKKLTVPAVEADAPPPKPKKFFKSRNSVPSENAALPTSSGAPADTGESFASSFGARDKPKRAPKAEPQVPKLKIHVERSPKSNKSKFFATKASKKEEPPPAAPEEKTHLGPNKRYLVRNRDRVINYSEDRDSPPPLPPPPPPEPPRVQPPKTSPAAASATVTHVKPGLLSPTNKDGKPPIVLRISKGTSRLLSTDSDDVTESESPTTREPDPPDPPPAKHDGLKLLIKYGRDKKGKSARTVEPASEDSEPTETPQSSRSTRSSKRNHHKEPQPESDITSAPKPGSPTPGSENYELYRTLASPDDGHRSPEGPESETGRTEPSPAVTETNEHPTEDRKDDSDHCEADDTKPAESTTGRAMRHRQNINYAENADVFVDEVASSKVNKNPAKSYVRKNKRRLEAAHASDGDSEKLDDGADSVGVSPTSGDRNSDGERARSPIEPEIPKAKTRKSSQKSSYDFDGPTAGHEATGDVPERVKSSDKQTSKNSDRHVFKSPKRPISEGNSVSSDGEDKPSVKLVITKKKGSIFKSRSLLNDGPGATGKKRHLYKHKWADDGKGGQTPRPEPEASAQVALQEFEEENKLTRVTRYQKDKNPSIEDEVEPYTSVKCAKNAKDYYTVVRNVKKAHQIQEIGEFQEFNDDVEYILDALQDNNPMSTRCLSAITLASKCTAPAFRMHVRAHGTVAKFFRALHDATNDQSLGLCTATVMFVLSQDRLNMDLDKESLELMLNLLESDVSHRDALEDCGLTSVQLAKNKERVRELCAEIKSQGKAKHLDLDNITVGHLAMETLLSLTSKRAGEWFKEELRALGGVDHILSTICDCCAKIGDYVAEWTPDLLDLLRKIDRCMRVLENITQQNEENQTYLVGWKNGEAVDTLVRLFRLCDREIPLYPTSGAGSCPGGAGATIRDALLPTLKVLINLTHSFRTTSVGSTIVGEQKGIIDANLHLLLQAPNYIPDHSNFEFSVCVLLLLINLMQNNSANIKLLVEAQAPADFEAVFRCNKPAIQALVDHFYKQEELARLAEKNTDAILDGEKTKEDENEFIEETVAKLLQKAGTHMEHTMVGSYIVLLLGHVVMDSPENEEKIRACLPQNGFQDMLTVLRKYFSFLNLTASAEAAIVAHVKATEKIINYLDKCDKKLKPDDNPEPGSSGSAPSIESNSPTQSQPGQEASYAGYSTMNATNNSNADFTSDSDKMSSSMELDSSFN